MADKDTELVGQRIRKRRIELKISQEELANMVGYTSKTTINKIEKTGRGIRTCKIKEFANALSVSPDYLMGWEEKSDCTSSDSDEHFVLGENIKYLRKKHNISQDDLANMLNKTSFTTVHKWESGRASPPIKDIIAIADYFGITIDELVKKDLCLSGNKSIVKTTTIAERLKTIMDRRHLRQVDVLEICQPYCKQYKVKLAKNDLSQYLSGKVEPSNKKLSILSYGLNVSEVWLMGYDVAPDMNALKSTTDVLDQLEQAHGQDVRKVTEDYIVLDNEDQAEIRGEIKHMLKADKYKERT